MIGTNGAEQSRYLLFLHYSNPLLFRQLPGFLGKTAQCTDLIDQLLRSRSFRGGLLLILYFLPALLAGAPSALGLPWVLIPNAHFGFATILGLGPLFHDETIEICFMAGFHLLFWPICISLLLFSRRMPRTILWTMSWPMIVIVAMMIPGCAQAIDAVGH